MINTLRKHLVCNAATILKPPAHLLPSCAHKKLLLEILSRIFSDALEDGDFEFLEDKWLQISILDLDLHWFISYQNEALVIADDAQQQDVRFAGNLNDLVLIMGRKEDPDTLFFQRRLIIEGDTELGLEVKNLMDSVDWEALPPLLVTPLQHLSQFVAQGLSDNNVTDNQHAY